MSFLLLLNIKEDILKNVGNQTVDGPQKTILWKSMGHQLFVWLHTFFKMSSFMYNRRKKLIQVWNSLIVSKWWQKYNFWVNFHFNLHLKWSHFILRSNSHINYDFCLNKLLICCLLIVSYGVVKFRYWVGLGCRIWSCRICANKQPIC